MAAPSLHRYSFLLILLFAHQPTWAQSTSAANRYYGARQQGNYAGAGRATNARPGYPARNAQSTAGQQKSYDFTDSVTVDGVRRSFIVHIPSSYDRSRSMPVVLVFHGLHIPGSLMIPLTGFNSTADRNGFIVVYGEGINRRWDDGRSTHADDVGYVCAVLDRLSAILNLDKRRVYAAGISNG
ncbi:MAG TPA: hypothetical protein V6D17_09055, partial [Candidatus Obscuribacterales bacterium]